MINANGKPIIDIIQILNTVKRLGIYLNDVDHRLAVSIYHTLGPAVLALLSETLVNRHYKGRSKATSCIF